MVERNQSVVDIAREFVVKKELRDLKDMEAFTRAEITHAKGCGCHSCDVNARKEIRKFANEAVRLKHQPEVDEEEERILRLNNGNK